MKIKSIGHFNYLLVLSDELLTCQLLQLGCQGNKLSTIII